MADEAKESGSEQANQGVPTPKIAAVSDDKPTSNKGLSAEDIRAIVREETEKQWQSGKDKRLNKVERMPEPDELTNTVSLVKKYLAATGGDEIKAAREMQIDQMIASRGSTGTATEVKAPRTNLAEQTADILKTAGIDPFDPEVVELSQKPYASEFEWLKTVTSLAVSRVNKTVADTPPPSGVINDGRAKPAVVVDKEGQLNTLYAQLESLYPEYTKNQSEITRIEGRIKELGGEL
jgi:hypothetical protein